MQKIFEKKLERKSIILIVCSFIVAFIVALSLLWTPQKFFECDVDAFKPISSLTPSDVDGLTNCVWNQDGSIEVTGEDPNIIFNNLTDVGRVVLIRFAEPLHADTEMEVFPNIKWGFNEAQKVKKQFKTGDTYAYFVFPDEPYTDLRIDIGINCKIASIELGNEGALEINATSTSYPLVKAVGFAILAAFAVLVLEQKKCVADRIINWFVAHKAEMLRGVIALLIFGVLAAGASYVYCNVIHDIAFMSVKGLYTFVMVTAFVFFLLCGVACIWHHRNTLKEDFEKVFVKMTLIVGLAMIVISPFAHVSWDIDSHYRLALMDSYLGDVKYTQSDWLVTLPSPDTLIKETADENFINMGILAFGYNDIIYDREGYVSLPHMPSGIFLALGRLLGLPFVLLYMFGKVPNLLMYTGLCYLGMKQLKNGKRLLAVVALFPSSLLLATNYSYDYWVTSLSIFAMAYFVGLLQDQERKATGKDAFIISACFALACVPKKIYFPLLLIPFLMPPKKIENKKKYYLIVLLILVVLFASFLMTSTAQIEGGGDYRGGSAVGPADQLAFVFGDIFGYAIILLRFLFTEYLTIANMQNYMTYYAYLGVAGGSSIIILLLALTFLFDKEKAYTKDTKSDWWNRIYVILAYVGGSALVASALYVAFTPVGHPTVLGCQARYIIPWIFPMLSVWSMNRIKPLIPQKVLSWAVVLGCYGLVFYHLATVFLPSVACLG